MYIWILIPLSFILVLSARLSSGWVEHFFVPFIYRPLHYAIGTLVSLVPFSVTEVLFLATVGLSLWYITRLIIRIVKSKSAWKHHLYKAFVNFVCVLSIALFAFEICMGLNYYRYTAAHYLDLDVKERSVEELYDVCVLLVEDMNVSRAKMQKNKDGIAVLSDDSRAQTGKSAMEAFEKMSKDYTFLKGAKIRNKPLLSSKLFSMALTTGLYFPYTFESNINVDVPEHTIPATMCHELSHSRGFMREDEANFLGYLACTYSDRADFNYSGAVMAFNYCFNRLYEEDITLAKKVANMCDSGIIDDIVFEDEYWEKYIDTPVAEATDKVYSGYLQSNGQQSGTKSYGEMVDLLLAYYAK